MAKQQHALSTHRRDTGDLWSRALDSRYATMKLADTAMVVEGIVDKGVLLEIREISPPPRPPHAQPTPCRPNPCDASANSVGHWLHLLE